jgi:hypothetical protein
MSFHPSPRLCAFFLLIALFSGPVPALAQVEPPKEVTDAIAREDAEKLAALEGRAEGPIVLELFTTSDCSACVFADRILYESMKDKQVIALSCHIQDTSELKKPSEKEAMGDESNYKGPMDPCVFRQWTYKSGRTMSDVTLSIPLFVFNGYDEVDAADSPYFHSIFNAYHYAGKNKTMEIFLQWKDQDTITVHLPQDPNYERNKPTASVWIIRYKDIEIKRMDAGINKGRVLRFSNIVQSIKHIAKWHGQMRSIDVDVEKPKGGDERGGYVVLMQEMMGEPILGAGKLVDYPLTKAP